MEILKVEGSRREYLDLLLLADESMDMVLRYLDKGEMYILLDGGTLRAECVVLEDDVDTLEIKNLSVLPSYQRMGYGSSLIRFLENEYRNRYYFLQVGTGNSPMTIPFYERCGFVKSGIRRNFFLENYDHPIYEDGVRLVDMIVLRKVL